MLTMVAVLIWPSRQSGVVDRLRDVRTLSGRFNRGAGGGFVSRNGWDSNVGGGAGRRTTAALPRSGIAQVLASAIARMAGGGTLVEAFEEQFGGRFAVRRLTPQRLTDLFERRRLPDESRAQSVRAAMGAAAAATVSEELGCRALLGGGIGCLLAYEIDAEHEGAGLRRASSHGWFAQRVAGNRGCVGGIDGSSPLAVLVRFSTRPSVFGVGRMLLCGRSGLDARPDARRLTAIGVRRR